MAITYRIYKGSEKVVEGASPLTITGLDTGAKVAAGTYHIVRVQDEKESEKVAIPAFTVLAGRSLENKPTEANTIPEIKEWLTAHSIDFTGKTTKTDLLALVP
ncbi:hypothetical protein [Enterococcus faecalis]|uniref:hypothetical protein n=1 Tax=Enterococcus faecalis TaxID=1351 RepID=UPI0001B258FC|nr:hypothetical protein [Enterococcus faecalis]EEU16584.1 predicted protein [Enterococcus faecalis ATCC 4200]